MSVKNFVQCGLVTPVAANTSELVLMAPTASYQYPPLDGGTLVIADSVARPSFYEIISYTHRIENVLYGVVRAKEGTTARTWSGVTWIYQALTAQDYVDALALKAALASPAFTGIPTAPTAALGTNTNQIATMAAVKAAIDNLIGGAPGALDALNEFAAALGNDPNFATTMTNALAGKEPSIAAGTSAQMWLGNKTWASVLTQVQGTLLTGLGVGANTPIVSTDTLIGALAKLQNQLNNKTDFTDSRLSDAREWTAAEVSQAEAQGGSATIPRKWSALRVWQAVLASSLTGLNLTVGTAVAASDTVLVAIGKLQKQITDAASNFAGTVRATVLTGYVSGSNAVLASTDTVLAAFGKLQAQITGLATSKLDATANAVSATKLQTARTIALSGDVTGSGSFDGSGNLTIAATVADNSHSHTIANVSGLQAALVAASGLTLGENTQDPNGAASQVILSNHANTPNGILGTGFYWHITTTFYSTISSTGNRSQIAVQYNGGNQCFARSSYDGVWTAWARLDNSSVAASALTGVIADAQLSGTYTGVSITGNAATATTLSGLTATITELNYVDGVTSNIQTQLNGKAASGHSHPDYYTHDGTNTGWFRSTGTQGWYNATYGGGICMTDSTYVRTYNNKQFLCNDVMRVEGPTPQVQLWDTDHSILRHLYAGGGTIGFLNSAGAWSLMNDDSGNTTSIGNVTAYSDIRLKKDIELIPDALDKVLALRGVTYERIDNGERQTGVIAQEVHAVLPEAVMTGSDKDATLSVAYGNLAGLLIEAIKELKAEVEELKLKVAA